jgi:hypothetical protein
MAAPDSGTTPPSAKITPKSSAPAQPGSDVGDSRSDDPSDDSADP